MQTHSQMTVPFHPDFTRRTPERIFLLDASRGIYLPRDFTDLVDADQLTGADPIDWSIVNGGPGNDYYYESWDALLRNMRMRSRSRGTIFRFEEDEEGNLFAVEDDR
ncbi:MAG: hypothetical protein FKY71_09960 [Spiribacter salinus]|uniref:Uncharacterized protein n=1 Tax=Spiribacter salinus TaxID=1335746 RepID=A0A540VR97_9GAMM|nr:MAG: hypothetical protein FKY71_09960 [Spiribacter salinus]